MCARKSLEVGKSNEMTGNPKEIIEIQRKNGNPRQEEFL